MNRYSMCVATLFAACAITQGDVINIAGDAATSLENTGVAFDAMLDYSYLGSNSGTLTIEITNSTTELDIGGFLTGFVFNVLSADEFATASLISGSHPGFLDTGAQSAAPFGMFDAGAALGANWNGGGNPSSGLSIGEMGTFDFAITAFDADSLSASSFIGIGSDFAVRFRGLDNGGSDKLLAPSPGTGAVALLGLGAMARRRR